MNETQRRLLQPSGAHKSTWLTFSSLILSLIEIGSVQIQSVSYEHHILLLISPKLSETLVESHAQKYQKNALRIV